MRRDAAFGISVGLLCAAVSIIGNVLRGDRHTLSLAPDLLSLLAITALLFIGLEAQCRRLPDRTEQRRAGMRTALIVALVFAASLAAFTGIWIPTRDVPLTVAALASTFAVSMALGGLFVWLRTSKAA